MERKTSNREHNLISTSKKENEGYIYIIKAWKEYALYSTEANSIYVPGVRDGLQIQILVLGSLKRSLGG